MTDEQRIQIINLRDAGKGYKKIAQITGLSENTVKSFCQRRRIGGVALQRTADESVCQCCGKTVMQNPGRKQKKFCSDRCRMKWWNTHLDQVQRKANYDFICPVCKKSFTVYGNANRKYCSHDCYIEDRFGGGRR
jgi:hypothetical protein